MLCNSRHENSISIHLGQYWFWNQSHAGIYGKVFNVIFERLTFILWKLFLFGQGKSIGTWERNSGTKTKEKTLILNLKSVRRAAVENVNMNKFHSCRTSRKKGGEDEKVFKEISNSFPCCCLVVFSALRKGAEMESICYPHCCRNSFFVLKDIKMDSGRRTKLMLTNFNDSPPTATMTIETLTFNNTHNEEGEGRSRFSC